MASVERIFLEPMAVSTAPGVVEKPELTGFDTNDTQAVIEWRANSQCAHFKVRWWMDGEDVHNVTSLVPSFTLNNLKQGSNYNVQIAAVIGNDRLEQQGNYSEILTFNTAPKAPRDLRVLPGLKSPHTSFIVKFADDDAAKITSYKISWRSLSDGETKVLATNVGFANIENLTPGDKYDVWITATREGAESKPCGLQEPVQTHPAQPTGLSVKNASATSATLSWNKVFSAHTYHVKWKRSDRGYQTITTHDTELALQNLDNGCLYNVCMAAENSAGVSDYTEIEEFTTDLVPPSQPQTSVFNSGENIGAKVSFTGSTQEQIREYVVELVVDGEEAQRVKTSKTCNAVFDKLDHGVCYVPCVYAVAENGVESRKIYGDPIWTCPAKITGVRSKPMSKNSEKITWKEVDGAESYIVIVQEDGKEPELEQEIQETEIPLFNLNLNTKFSVRIAANNRGGKSRLSSPVTFQTALCPTCNIRVGNILIYRESGILVSWDPCDGATEYHVDMIEVQTNHKTPRKTTAKCSYEFYDLTPGCQYKASVQCIAGDVNRNSTMKYSDSIWTYCSKVEEVDVQFINLCTFEITWEEVHGAKNYKLLCKASDGTMAEQIVKTNRHTLTNLELGQTFTLLVQPMNEAGDGKESDPVTFKTGMSPPSSIQVQNDSTNPQSSIKVTFSEPKNKPSEYKISVVPVSADGESQSKTVCVSHCVVSNLIPGTEYIVYVSSLDNDEHYNSEEVSSEIFCTAPGMVTGITTTKDSPRSQNITWDAATGATSYEVKVQRSGSPPYVMTTQRNEIHLDNLALHSKYTLVLRAKNEGGYSKDSEKGHFETALQAPRNISVKNNQNNPTSVFDIHFDEPELAASRYRIRLINLGATSHEPMIVNRQQALSWIRVNDLGPGESYQIAVCSIHDSNEDLNSEEIIYGPIRTCVPELVVETQPISRNAQKVTWNNVDGILKYKVMWRVEHRDWQEMCTNMNEAVLNDLKPGCNYDVKVMAINETGQDQEPGYERFTTVPATPANLQREILSPGEVLITCDESEGATIYIFNINGKTSGKNERQITLGSGNEILNFTIRVTAQNHAGCSQASDALNFRQTLLHLKKKFTQMVKNTFEKSRFVPPLITEIPSGDMAADFGTDDFIIGNGETVFIEGSHFTGKTASLSYFLQTLPSEKIGIYLDYDDYKNLNQKFDVKALLQKSMADLSPEEMDFVIQWMKEHSDEVVFVVDNLTLPSDYGGKQMSYTNKETSANVFYNLVKTNRDIFPDSQVLCSTSQSDLPQIVKPNRTLKIDGFEDDQIQKMKAAILKEKSDVEMPEQLSYFCKNPGYCEVILRLIKNKDPDVDLMSYSSTLIKIISESVRRYSEVKGKEKVDNIFQGVKQIEKKLGTAKVNPSRVHKNLARVKSQSGSTRATSIVSDVPSFIDMQEGNGGVKDTCDTLHDYITKALYFGLHCPLKEFKKRFQKKSISLGVNAKIWIMAAGLLRDQTTKLAADLFEISDEKLNAKVTQQKFEFTKEFCSGELERIKKQASKEPQIVLDWFNIINELDDADLLNKCKFKIEITISTGQDEIEQLAKFLRRVPEKFCPSVRVKFGRNVNIDKSLYVETAIKDNKYWEAILVEHADSKKVRSPWRGQSANQSLERQRHHNDSRNLPSPRSPTDGSVFPDSSNGGQSDGAMYASPTTDNHSDHEGSLGSLNPSSHNENEGSQNGSDGNRT